MLDDTRQTEKCSRKSSFLALQRLLKASPVQVQGMVLRDATGTSKHHNICTSSRPESYHGSHLPSLSLSLQGATLGQERSTPLYNKTDYITRQTTPVHRHHKYCMGTSSHVRLPTLTPLHVGQSPILLWKHLRPHHMHMHCAQTCL
jgi:hypothetical protein